MLGRLDAYVETCWQSAKNAKELKVEPEMLEDMRQREGLYSAAKLAEIKQQGGSEIFMQLTNLKCRAALGWLRDVLLPSGERPFTCKAPAIPDELPPEIKAGIYQRTMGELQQAMTDRNLRHAGAGVRALARDVRPVHAAPQRRGRNPLATRGRRDRRRVDRGRLVSRQWTSSYRISSTSRPRS
jgi:hypothetical protein